MIKYTYNGKKKQNLPEYKVQGQNKSHSQQERPILKRRYSNKRLKNRLQSVIIVQGISGKEYGEGNDKGHTVRVREKFEELMKHKKQRKQLKKICRASITKVRQAFPIILYQHVQFIAKIRNQIIQKIPMTEELISEELVVIIKRRIYLRKRNEQANIKKASQHRIETVQMKKGEEKDTEMKIEASKDLQQKLMEEKEIQGYNNSIEIAVKHKQYLRWVIEQLEELLSKWKEVNSYKQYPLSHRSPSKSEGIESGQSHCSKQVNEKTVNVKPNPLFSEQENQKIKQLSIYRSQLSFQIDDLRQQYKELLRRNEDIFPLIIEDQKFKSQRIEVKHPQSARLIHYATFPTCYKDIYEESGRIRARLHKQFKKDKKDKKNSQDNLKQFDKAKSDIQNKIKVLQFRRVYLQIAIKKIKTYLQDDRPQVTLKQCQVKQQNQGQIFFLESIKKIPFGNEGEIQPSKGISFEKNNSLKQIIVSCEREKKSQRQISRFYQALQAQRRKLRKQYINLLSKGKSIGAPFLNDDEIIYIQLRGSKYEKNKKIYISRPKFDRYLALINGQQYENIIKKQKNLMKAQSFSGSDIKIQKSSSEKKALGILKKSAKNDFLRQSIIALKQYLSKWEQMNHPALLKEQN